MATNFFAQQDTARRRTGLLLVYFVLAVVMIIALSYLVVAGTLAVSHGSKPARKTSGYTSAPASPSLWQPWVLVAVTIGVGAVVGGTSALKVAQLASGGRAVALMLDGKEIIGNAAGPAERRLLNVVEEMAIASGVPVPPVFVMENEPGINAFAAGFAPGDAVVAVSEGCLKYLNRDELQGVVAHEFSHILNGDMRLNIRLIGLIAGIMALTVLGRILIEVAVRGRSSSSSSKKGDGRGAFLLIGVGLYVIGLGGAFFGRLIQSAISRQREYLADASAVQFTRNPDGIAGALKKIGGLAEGSRIKAPQSAEVAHMFFGDGLLGKRFISLLATHPPLKERIQRLDPSFDGNYPRVKSVTADDDQTTPEPKKPRLPGTLPGLPNVPLPVLAVADQAVSRTGDVTQQELDHAHGLQESIPPILLDAAYEPYSARALVYCLLLDSRARVRDLQLRRLTVTAEPAELAETHRLVENVMFMSDELRLPLLDLSLPALRQMSPSQHEDFRRRVDALITADNDLSLFEYALQCVLTRHLDEAYGVRPTRAAARGSPSLLVSRVLSLLAWEGHDAEDSARAAYEAGLQRFLGTRPAEFPLLTRDQCTLSDFDAALAGIATLSRTVRRTVLASCAVCVLTDRKVTVRESELLRAIADNLGLPLPPLSLEPSADQSAPELSP